MYRINLSSILAKLSPVILFAIFNCCERDYVPSVITESMTDLTLNTAKIAGYITSDGGTQIIERGICWSTNETPTISDNIKTDTFNTLGSFSIIATDLLPDRRYYYRAFALNKKGVGYGESLNFNTYLGTASDLDGNVYNTVKIGSQIWMVENLKVMRFRNGDVIPNITSNDQWVNTTSAAYCNFNNNESLGNTYGRLYNSYAMIDLRNIAPQGWHVPIAKEWETLFSYLGGDTIAGGKMKVKGTQYWHFPNTGATNESNFTALPWGFRVYYTGFFDWLRYYGLWWSSTKCYNYLLYYIYMLEYDSKRIEMRAYEPNWGLSIRCIKD
jgi:uncharacterized protein (TIGR02145 family)